MKKCSNRLPPMTVLFLIDLLHKMGGAERNICLVAEGLRNRGHTVIICSLQGGELSQKMRQEGFQVEELNIGRIYDFNGIRKFLRILRIAFRQKVSVIITYHESSDCLGLLISLLSGIPILSNRRDMGFKLKPRHVWLYRLINRFFDQIIAVSSAVKDVIVEKQRCRPEDIAVIPNGIDLSSLNGNAPCSPLDVEIEESCSNICCLANIRPIKGLEYLVVAAASVVKEFPSARFYLVGEHHTDTRYYADLQSLIKVLDLERVVRFTGEFHHSRVRSLLASMDVSVLPSLSEGMSNTLLESMAVGKPVVATRVGGNCEVVEDGKTGYLVASADERSLAAALVKLLSQPALCEEMGRAGKLRVAREFSVTRMVDRYEDILQYAYLRMKPHLLGLLYKRFCRKAQLHRRRAKLVAAQAVHYIGLITVFRHAKRLLRLGRVKILCFHDVSVDPKPGGPFSIYVGSDDFKKFLNFLARHYRIVSLKEATDLLEKGTPLEEDVYALTFDDCYRGWTVAVLPEAQKLGTPFAVFALTGILDGGLPPLYDALIYLSKKTWRKAADLSRWGLNVYLIGRVEEQARFVYEVHRCWKGRTQKERERLLTELSEYFGVSLASNEELQEQFATWEDIRTLDRLGVEIGAHTISHPLLNCLPDLESFSEISHSKRRLEEELGHPVSYFAYPFGIPENSKHDGSPCIVKMAGFKNAFTLDTTHRKMKDPFSISRRSINSGLFRTPNGDFNEALLDFELSGLSDFIFFRSFRKQTTRKLF